MSPIVRALSKAVFRQDFCAYVSANVPSNTHGFTVNEGAAVALASGYHMASGKAAMVYLQNSGLGNVSVHALRLNSPPLMPGARRCQFQPSVVRA